jgi:hypothetical protein
MGSLGVRGPRGKADYPIVTSAAKFKKIGRRADGIGIRTISPCSSTIPVLVVQRIVPTIIPS